MRIPSASLIFRRLLPDVRAGAGLFWSVIMFLFLSIVTGFGQAYDWKPVKLGGGGFVSGITFHPNVSGLMYCRTDIGGAYRWDPATDSWTQLLDFLGFDFWPNDESSLHGVESIGLDAQDPNRLYLSCGWLSNPNEILISTNQGASFTRITSPFQIRANNDGRGTGERFGVDPNLGSTIFYGTRSDGLWKSTNHAANWSKVASFPVNTTANGVGLSFVEFVASSGTPGNATPVMWVGVSQGGTNLYRSTDGGATWTSVSHGAPSTYMPLRASQDGLGNMYVTFSDGAGPNGIGAGVVRKINLSTLTSTDVTPPTGQGGFAGVSVDRQNPNTVVVTTANRWWPMSDIYRSTNGGASWSAVYNGTVDMSSSPYMNPTNGNVIQGWMFDIKIDPYNSNRVYYGTGGGVFSSYNFTAGQPSWEFRSDGIEEGVSTSVGMNLACPPSGGPQLYSVFGDIGGFAHYDLDTSPPLEDLFFNPQGGNNYGINFAEQSPNIVVRTYYTSSAGRGGCISSDWGKTWTIFPTQPAPVQTDGPGYVTISADAGRLIWAVPGYAPFYSTNNGATWTQSTGPSTLTPDPGVQLTPFADRVNPNKFYLYTPSNGRVFVSTDGGASFSETATITGSWDHSMHTPFGQEGQVWIAVWDGLWRSTDSGASFSKVSGVQAARSIGFGRTATGTGYPVAYMHGKIGGVWGVYRSENQGASWIRINDDQHQYGGIAQVIGDPKIYGRCYIKALGILYGDIPNQPPPAPANLVATASNAVVQLSWSNISTADSYTVKRSTTSGSGYVTIASGVTATSYSDSGVANGTTYYYVVAATNAFGVSPDSTEASATPTDAKALYAFEGNAQDTSGSGNHGTATAVSYVAGKVGAQAAQFNGSSSYVSIPRSVTDNFSVTMWVKTTDTSGSAGAQWWAGKGLVDGEVGGGGADWGTSIVNGKFVLGVGSSSADTTVASTSNINNGTWHHLVATRDNANGAMQVYVDGVLQGSGTGATGSRTLPPALRIGSLQTGNNFLNGTLDDVRLYSRILTATEIAALASGAPPAVPAGLVANPGDGSIALSWSAAAGASGYSIKRSITSGSGYTTVGTVTGQTSFIDTGLTNGTTYYYVVSALNTYGESANSSQLAATPLPQAPYGGTPWPVPGVIETENFDNGGQGSAYNDSDTANSGGQYRSEGVDVETCGEGGYNVGWTAAGEWLEYTVNVAFTGSYDITLRTASASSQSQGHVEFDGVDVTGLMTTPATGGWQTYADVTAPDVTLTAGQHVMRIYFDGGGWNLNRVTISSNLLPAPQNVTATGGSSQIALSWNAVAGATTYTIQRSASIGGPYTELVTGVSGASYANTGLGDSETWHYQVSAQGGESTAPVSATTYTAEESWRFENFGTIDNTGDAADSADPDGDGWTNAQEFISGTDPNDRASLLKIDSMQASGNDMLVNFPSVAGRTYRVEYSATLLDGSWVTVQDNIDGTGNSIQITDTGGAGHDKRFYRIVVE